VVAQVRGLSGAIVATNLHTRTLAGFPIVTNLTADDDSVKNYMRASGMNTSLSEGQVLEHAYRSPAASTTRILGTAAGQQIPIFQVNQGNVDRVVAQLTIPDANKQDIRTAVAQGATVVVPRSAVTIGGWTGVGYVVARGLSADYRISGGASGGGWELPNVPIPGIPTDKGSFGVMVAVFLGFPKQAAACVSAVLDTAGLLTYAATFETFLGGWMAPFLAAGLFTPGAFVIFAVLLAYVAATVALVWGAVNEWNDANTCINREGL
jgi:hypothetical protein